MRKPKEEYSDAELFDLMKGEKKEADWAFAELYARHSPRVFAYCRRFLGNREEAQDVFQETFIRFYNAASKERLMTNVPAFLLRIARNLCFNQKRDEKEATSFEDYMYVEDDKTNEREELLDLIKMALEVLPDEYKEIFILREYDGMSYNDISEITGQSLANVKVRIFRAKQKVREILEPYLKELSNSKL